MSQMKYLNMQSQSIPKCLSYSNHSKRQFFKWHPSYRPDLVPNNLFVQNVSFGVFQKLIELGVLMIWGSLKKIKPLTQNSLNVLQMMATTLSKCASSVPTIAQMQSNKPLY